MNPAVLAALDRLNRALPASNYRVSTPGGQEVICEPTLVIVDSPMPTVAAALACLFNALVAARGGVADEPVEVG